MRLDADMYFCVLYIKKNKNVYINNKYIIKGLVCINRILHNRFKHYTVKTRSHHAYPYFPMFGQHPWLARLVRLRLRRKVIEN